MSMSDSTIKPQKQLFLDYSWGETVTSSITDTLQHLRRIMTDTLADHEGNVNKHWRQSTCNCQHPIRDDIARIAREKNELKGLIDSQNTKAYNVEIGPEKTKVMTIFAAFNLPPKGIHVLLGKQRPFSRWSELDSNQQPSAPIKRSDSQSRQNKKEFQIQSNLNNSNIFGTT